jgi:hypothetical protein
MTHNYKSEVTETDVSELIIGERAVVRTGLCRVTAQREDDHGVRTVVDGGMRQEPTHLAVNGENRQTVKVIPIGNRTPEAIRKAINRAIRKEMASL